MSPSTRTLLALTTLALTASACTDEPQVTAPGDPFTPQADLQSGPAGGPQALVYTQNMLLGGDTGPLFSLDFGAPDALPQIIAATAGFYAQVQASNIPERAAEFVDEIEEGNPDVVALQEAVAYVEGSLFLGNFSFTPSAPGPDLLASVMAEIAARGLPYSVAEMQPTTAIALPIGPPDAGFNAPAIAVQDRVVLLKRDDVEAISTSSGIFAARLPLGPADIVRGWVSMTVDRDGTPWHYVSTHLETQGSPDPASGVPYFIRQVHNGQAAELQAILGANDGVTVLMGDLNSDAEAEPGEPSHTDTYANLIAAGWVDVWDTAPHARRANGYTCCVVDGDEPRTPDERIDFVLVKGNDIGGGIQDDGMLYHARIVGIRASDRTPSGLWPSDHGGLLAAITPVQTYKSEPMN